ncbi:MAG: polyketide cyclase [Hirschia sp.]|nr:polyketide cyclase [Hirschia sp.]|tara:strand:- start:331 stop:759 length:429 start_codon:yes stop_codon:yes gene_type:complete
MQQAIHVGTEVSAQDERSITAVLIAYATGIDRRNWPFFHSLFTYDCEADYGGFGKWRGATEITEYMKQAHADMGTTLHRISNIDIRMTKGLVHSRCYVDALLKPLHEGGPIHRGVGYYDDEFSRTASGWQISRRKFHAMLIE